MPSIKTLIPDIYKIIREKHTGWFNEQLAEHLSVNLAKRLRASLGEKRDGVPTLRMSKLGPQCSKALWLSLYRPELAEATPPWQEIKYSFGHVLEALLISLAKAAGHEVTGEQDVLELDGIIGHRDCVIDGCTVDVKSATSLSFQKFKTSNFELVDSFGYLEQLDAYGMAALNDPLVRIKDRGYLFAVDKQLGHLCLYEHKFRPEHIHQRIAAVKEVAALSSVPPCECRTETFGASGNRKLHFTASYSPFKWECFPQLRCFKYANGPIYLNKVVREPSSDVPEINKEGRIIYH